MWEQYSPTDPEQQRLAVQGVMLMFSFSDPVSWAWRGPLTQRAHAQPVHGIPWVPSKTTWLLHVV